MMGRYLLGIDAGTSMIKAAIFDETGQEQAVAAQRTTLLQPQSGWCEMDMRETWQAAAHAIRALLAQHDVPAEQIAAIGVTGNMIGAWLIDADGNPLRNAILWCDGRTQPLVARLRRNDPSFLNQIYHTSGSALEFGCTLPVVRWLAENEPQTLAQAETILCCKDWIVYRLTGTRQLDPTEASVLPGDTRRRTYSETMFAHFGIEAWRHLFPPVAPSSAVVGTVTSAAAAETGLRAGTPVVAGAGDVPSATVGAGAVEPGMACTVLGTTCHNSLVVPEPVFEPEEVGLLFCLPDAAWLRTMVNLAGTTNLDWIVRQLYGDADDEASHAERLAQATAAARQSPAGARGLIYLPYLSANGVIAPFVEPAARAQFSGLTSEHGRGDLSRAVFEGVALAIRDCYATVRLPQEIRLVGGGARSHFWSQLIADCTGATVAVPAGSEFGARGAALLASVGLGWYRTVQHAARETTIVQRTHEPDRQQTAAYDAHYQTYRDLRLALRPVWRSRWHRAGT